MGGCKLKQTAHGLERAKEQRAERLARLKEQKGLHKVGKDLVFNSVAQSPVPVVVLSSGQADKAKAHCMEVRFDSVEHDEDSQCWKPKWTVLEKGPKFDPRKEGLTVCRVKCISNMKKKKRTYRRLRFAGEPSPRQNMLVFLGRWNREDAKMGRAKNRKIDENLLQGVPTVKAPLFKNTKNQNQKGKHHGSTGCYCAHGKTASCCPKDDNQSSVHPFAFKNPSHMSQEEMEKLDNKHTLAMASEIVRAQEIIDAGALGGTTGAAWICIGSHIRFTSRNATKVSYIPTKQE